MQSFERLAEAIDWQKVDGLIPAVVQDAETARVLMLGYMNREALAQTIASGHVTFYSRSRARLWTKGESSGHWLELADLAVDCDGDTLLVAARPQGPTCHRGLTSCFDELGGEASHGAPLAFLQALDRVIAARLDADPASSYTARLAAAGMRRMAQKVGEEGVEVALAAADGTDAELAGEAADLIYHLMVLLRARGLSLARVAAVLEERHAERKRP